jgi:hypothetical protein
VPGRKELDKLAAQKQALLVESAVNRLVLQAEFQNLRSATAWVDEAVRGPRKLAPLLLILAPIAGFLLVRKSRRSDSWLNRATAALKWLGPLYGLWKRFSARRRQAEAANPPPA